MGTCLHVAMRIPRLSFCILFCVLSRAWRVSLRIYPVQQVDGQTVVVGLFSFIMTSLCRAISQHRLRMCCRCPFIPNFHCNLLGFLQCFHSKRHTIFVVCRFELTLLYIYIFVCVNTACTFLLAWVTRIWVQKNSWGWRSNSNYLLSSVAS